VVEVLLRHDADVHARDHHDNTVLHWSSCGPVTRRLLAAGAHAHARSKARETPLHTCHHPGGIDLLLAHGADLLAQDWQGNTPLHRAAHLRQTEVVHHLLRRGALPTLTNLTGQTPRDMTDDLYVRAELALTRPLSRPPRRPRLVTAARYMPPEVHLEYLAPQAQAWYDFYVFELKQVLVQVVTVDVLVDLIVKFAVPTGAERYALMMAAATCSPH
jgi:hypothetical protein